jgi:hypothetical protein
VLDNVLLVHAIPSEPGNDRELAHAQLPQPSFYLLRPDGHVGLAGTRLDVDVMKRYLTERLQLIAI